MTGPSLVELRTFAALAIASALLSGAYRRFALSRSILDVPNERSSHERPVPRGGGIAIVTVVLLSGMVYGAAGSLTPSLLALLMAAVMVGLVGWIDDRRPVSVRNRFSVHLLAGAAMVYAAAHAGLPIPVALFWGFCAVSAINVVNFMDGIDALVASQALIFALAMVCLAPVGTVARASALLLAATSFGFLVWNVPPARLFLGDVGSGFLGFASVAVGLLVALATGDSLVRIFLPLFALFLDSAVTLLRRLRNGERITQAHRSHLYQRLANGGWGHGRVSLAFAACAVVGAALTLIPVTEGWSTLLVTYVLLILLVGAVADRSRPFPTARQR